MSTQLTDRDKKLLFILGIVGIIAAFFLLAIRPLYQAITANDESISEAQTTLQVDQQKAVTLPLLTATNADAKIKILADTSDYYNTMTSDEVDKLLTSLVLSEGLISRDLTITMPTEEVTLSPYIYSTEKADADAAAEEKAEDEENTDSTASTAETSTDTSASSTASTSSTASGTTTASGDTSDTTSASTGVYAVEAVINVTGTKDSCTKLVDDLTTDFPSIRVTGFSWDEDSAYNNTTYDANGNVVINPSTVDTKNLEVDLEIYMMDRTSKEES